MYSPGRTAIYSLDIPLSGASIPANLQLIELRNSYRGSAVLSRVFQQPPSSSITLCGIARDAYGRPMQGQQTATVRVGYVYQAVYQKPAEQARAFAALSGIPLSSNRARQEFTFWQEWRVVLSAWDNRAQGLGGWSLHVQHSYDPVAQTLYLRNR